MIICSTPDGCRTLCKLDELQLWESEKFIEIKQYIRFRMRWWGLQWGGTYCLHNTRLSELSAAVHSSLPPTKRSPRAGWCYQCWMITPITASSLTSTEKGGFTKLKLEGKKVIETYWQGLGCDGETPSLLFTILSRTPPNIAGLAVRSRVGHCGWAMGAVSFLPSPGLVEWFPWHEASQK